MIGWLVRSVMRVAVWVYFRRIDADGVENVPLTGGVILASNHTNALVDPLVIQYVLPRHVTLTAKASLAENAYLRFLMETLGVLYFHRPAESGAQAASEANRQAIQACQEHLGAGGALCIFPEGKSHSEAEMLPFKLGLARIALGLEGPVPVVPVGLYYEQKERFRSAVSVRFGAPLEVDRHDDSARTLTKAIRRDVEALTVPVRRTSEGVLVDWVGRLLATDGAPPPALRDEEPLTDHVRRLHEIAVEYDRVRYERPEEVVTLEREVRRYRKELRSLGVEPAEVYLSMSWGRALHFILSEFEVLIVGGAIAAWGWLNHLLPFFAVRAIARRLTRERDQWASNAIYPALVVYPLFYVLQIALAWILFSPLWAVAYTLLLPFSGAYYVLWRDRVGAAWRRARTFLRWRSDKSLQARLAERGRAIIRDVRAVAGRGQGDKPWRT